MSARSKRLAGPVALLSDGTSQLLYTCPAGRVALVKSIRVTNPSGVAVPLEVGIGGTSAAQTVVRCTVAAESQYVDPDTDPIVLAAGESLYAQDQRGDASALDVTVTLSGAELLA